MTDVDVGASGSWGRRELAGERDGVSAALSQL